MRGAAVIALALALAHPAGLDATDRRRDPLEPDVVARERQVPPPLRGIRIEDRAGARVPLDLVLVDHDGARRTLGELCDGTTPVVLVLGYFRCPMLCGVVFERLRASLERASPALGRDYRVAAVSIDPRETPADARERRDLVVGALPDFDAAAAWSFFVAEESASRQLAEAVGFRDRFDPPSGQYAHAAGAFVLTPDGRVSRTLQGLEHSPAALENALAGAATGSVAASSAAGAILVQCFRFLPALRRHAGAIEGFLRAGAAGVVLGLVSVCVLAARRRRGRSEEQIR
ncbi:MAG TPA: SCO family protein [Planctomycetota bacterium]|nr:SCO family protein [Planctomycetota bacterium]